MSAYRTYLDSYEEQKSEGRRRVAAAGLAADDVLADELTGRRPDGRFGVNVIARPPTAVLAEIRNVQAELRGIDAAQYFYPEEDLHLTVLEIWHGRDRPASAEEVGRIRDAVAAVCATAPGVRLVDGRIGFDDRTVTLSCFPPDDRLDVLRDRLAAELETSGIVAAPRYRSRTAHVTFVRCLRGVERPDAWTERLRARQRVVLPVDWEIAELRVTAGATWYGRRGRIEEHGPFPLQSLAGKPPVS